MSETKVNPTAQTVISLILPETATMPRQGSILAKYESADGKQSLAHLMPFSYSSLADIARAVEAAQQQLETLKANPPQISVPTPVEVANIASKPVKATKPSSQKPQKKKISLDDFPQDEEEISTTADEADEVDVPDDAAEQKLEVIPAKPSPVPQETATGLKVGEVVSIPDGTVDVDGEMVPFSTGKIVELDLSANPPRVWLESADGEEDVWLPLASLTSSKAPVDDLSAFEKPLGMGIPNKEGQLTLFG